jgi:hypothetical protein
MNSGSVEFHAWFVLVSWLCSSASSLAADRRRLVKSWKSVVRARPVLRNEFCLVKELELSVTLGNLRDVERKGGRARAARLDMGIDTDSA